MSQSAAAKAKAKALQAERDQRDRIRLENERYMREHPDLNEAFQEFIYAVLKRRPDDIRAFAMDFFTKPIADN
jgi:hypothetical protein